MAMSRLSQLPTHHIPCQVMPCYAMQVMFCLALFSPLFPITFVLYLFIFLNKSSFISFNTIHSDLYPFFVLFLFFLQLYTFFLFLAFSYFQNSPGLFAAFGFYSGTPTMPVFVGLVLFSQTIWSPVDKVIKRSLLRILFRSATTERKKRISILQILILRSNCCY